MILPPVEKAEAKVFHMGDDDEGSVGGPLEREARNADGGGSASGSWTQGSAGDSPGNASSVVPPGGDLAQDIRRRFEFLCAKDQKTTVKRECQVATKREEFLLLQIQRTIDTYSEALQMSKVAERLDDDLGPTLSPEESLKYEERIKFLRGTIAVLEAEPSVSLPPLGALEATKGLVFASYARTASALKGAGDEAGLSQPISEAANGVRGAIASLFRGGNQGGNQPPEAAPAQSAPVTASTPS
jgi:hypothetical protein